jgi:hypothetical protein
MKPLRERYKGPGLLQHSDPQKVRPLSRQHRYNDQKKSRLKNIAEEIAVFTATGLPGVQNSSGFSKY